MSNLRRYYSDQQTYFITFVTFDRLPLLSGMMGVMARAAVHVRRRFPFTLEAWVVMPDHVHAIITPNGNTLSDIVHAFKLMVAGRHRSAHRTQRGRFWQHRFWDHIIRDQADLNRHIDYIHYNAVKHGLARDPREYAASSFQRYATGGYYPHGWGVREPDGFDGDYGE